MKVDVHEDLARGPERMSTTGGMMMISGTLGNKALSFKFLQESGGHQRMVSSTSDCAPACKVSFRLSPCRAKLQTHQRRRVRAGDSF